ncbi:uncharacterized protein LOC105193159 [Solenopsis invicta]|uniref:uncharacterized protein LOC105193159 n=1 Tax=Solenopsis invicta TaxID=13686 RepID=UPI00193C8B68|nr:uncharacterized protein LOC105193159 [Solenopsis invicta]
MARKNTFNRTLKFMLTLCGIWPGTPYVLLCRIFWVVSMTVILYFHYRYFYWHVRSAEILDLMDCLSSFIAYSKIIIKFFVFWLNERKFVEILAKMAEDWSDCANNDVGLRETARKAKLSDRITNSIVILHTMTIVLYCIGIILTDVDVTDTSKELPFMNKLDIPMDINTLFKYRIVLTVQFLYMMLSSWAAGITNSLLLTLILHTAGQIEIMRHWLAQLVPRKSEDKHKSITATASKIIQKHQKIISFTKNIENLYSYIALLQFVSNTIMICSLGFLIVTAIGSSNAVEQIMKSFLFYTITNLEAFIFCYAGEYLNNKSKEIGVAAYNCEWYDLKCTESRVLLFIILRSQKQLSLTVGKMMDLSLEAFTSAHMHSITIGDFIDCLSSFIAHCKVLFKCLVFWLNQRKFIEVLEVMREDWSDCANNDICMRETVRKAKVSERVTKVMMILHTTTIVTYSIGTILADIDVTNNTTELLFYTKVEFPFDVNTQRTYRFILAIDFFFLLMCSWCAGIMNTLLLILIMTRKSTINRIAFLMLPWFGISSGRLIILITRLFWIVTTAFVEYCHYLYFSTHLNSENFFNLVDCFCSFLAHAKVITKLVAFWVNQRKFEETLALITDDWSDYAKNDIGMRVMTGKAKVSDRITYIILILHTMTIVLYSMGIIIADADVTETIELPFINKLVLPFSINTQHMYRFVLIAEFIHMMLSNFVAGVYNAILLAMVFHTGGQIDILQCWLAQLQPKNIENKQKSIVVMANKIVLKHQKIIEFSENIESLYTYLAMLLFALNTLLICTIAFIIVTALGTADAMEQIIKCILFFTITNLEAFVFCYAGEYLSNKSREVGFATYNCEWYNLKSKDSQILLFIILRSQKQLTLTAGKIMDLTLQSFASIMNASGSYLSMLLAMQ